MTPEQQKAVALARAKAKARARGTGKTYTQGQSFNEGIGDGVYIGARDEAEGGAAVRRRLGGGGLDEFAKNIPFGQIPLAVFDAAGGFVQDLAPGLYGGGVQKVYEGARDERRTIQKVAAADNPLSYGGGQILGSTVTLAPLGATPARSSAMVADDLLREGAKLTGKAATAKLAPRATALTAKAAAKTTRAAQLARPAATAGEFTARAGRIVGESAGKGLAYGAGIGGALGFTAGEGDLGDRAETATDAAVVGGVAGGVLGPVIQGLAPIVGGIAYKITTPKEVKGLDMVIKRMQRSGTTPEGIKAQFDQWNKTGEVPETLAEFMGPNERSLLSALITVNRETREQATNIFVGRGKEEVNRLEDAFAGSFGAKRGDYAAAQTQAAKARVEDPEPFYKAAHFDQAGSLKPLGPEKMSTLNNILADEDDIVRIAKDATADLNRMGNKSPAHKAARDEVRLYAEALQAARGGERVQVPQLSVLAADYIERAINKSYKAAGGGSGEISGGIAGWKALRNSVRDVIDDTGIGEARATSAERIRRGELLEEGLKIMNKSVDVDDVNRIMTGIPDADIPSASPEGRKAYGVGASRAIANELRDVPNMKGFADATNKVARTQGLREKLEAARPKVLTKSGAENKGSKQTKANAALDQAIERASDRAQFGIDMVGNSKTAFRQGDVTDAVMDDAFSQQAGEAIGDLLIAGAGGVTQKLQERLGRAIGNRIGQPSIYRPQINREAANILLATGDQIPVQVARIAKRAADRANGRARIRPMVPPPGSPPPTPTRASGFGLGPDAANALAFGTLGGIAPADSDEERLRNIAIGTGIGGFARRGSQMLDDATRTVGKPRNAFAGTRTQGFVGGRSQDPSVQARLTRAAQMEQQGATKEEIWTETMSMRGADGKWRAEIDDSVSSMSDDIRYDMLNGKTYEGRLSRALSHPEFEKSYPSTMDDILLSSRIDMDTAGSFSNPGRPQMHAQAGSTPEIKSVLLHEMQHAAQAIEGFGRGGSPKTVPVRITSQEAEAHAKQIAKWGSVNYDDLSKVQQQKYNKLAADDLREKQRLTNYKNLAGETEARNVQTRRNLSMEERRNRPAWMDEDVPRDQQTVKFNADRQETQGVPSTPQQAARFETPGSPDPTRPAGFGSSGPKTPKGRTVGKAKDELKSAISGTLQQPAAPLGKGAMNMMGSQAPRPAPLPAQQVTPTASVEGLQARIAKLEKEARSPFTPNRVKIDKLDQLARAKEELGAARAQKTARDIDARKTADDGITDRINATLPEGMAPETAGKMLRETPVDQWPAWAWRYESELVARLVKRGAPPEQIKARTGRTVVKPRFSTQDLIVFPPGVDEAKAAQMLLDAPDGTMFKGWQNEYLDTRDDILRARWNRRGKK